MEKKKNSKHYIIPPSYFKNKGITPIPVVLPEKPKEVISQKQNKKETIKEQEIVSEPIPNNLEALQVKEPPPKIILKQDTKRSSGLSLSSIKAKKEHQIRQMDVVIDEDDLPKEDFTDDAFLKEWNTFIEDLEKKGKHNLASILSIDTPKINGTTIHLEFPNSTNKVEVERQQYDLLMHLRKSLNNFDINLSITVNEVMEKQFAYTAIEKFEKLKTKNANINLLRKTFDLDI